MKKRNFFAKELLSRKFIQKRVKPKKGKEVSKEKKLQTCANLLNNL